MISDVIMPDMDGYQLATEIQQRYPEIKIQMISGFTDERHLDRGEDAIYQNVLSKPCTSEALLKRVRSLLDHDE